MSIRVFVAFDKVKDNTAVIEGSDVNYIKNVMRLNVGDELTIMDSKSKEYSAKINSMQKNSILVDLIEEKKSQADPRLQITVAQGLPKNPKMDLIIQKSTELGVHQLIPVLCERSVIKLESGKADAKVARWQKIAKEAAEQSGGLAIPKIFPVMTFDKLIGTSESYDKCVMLWEMEKENTIKKFLQSNKGIKKLLVLIGPEGGFSHDEAEAAKNAGFQTVTIGNRILRTETAAIAVLSMIEYECEM